MAESFCFAPIATVLCTSLFLSCTSDGETYQTVVIGTQTWMARNLNYNASGRKCYSNSKSNCTTYGSLYDWATAMALPDSCNSSFCSDQIQPKHRGICPSGWHIPTNAEWQTLVDFAGGNEIAGKKLKIRSGWNEQYNGNSGNGTDDYGFSAIPGGRGYSGGIFYDLGASGHWWSSSESISDIACGRYMLYYNDVAYRNYEVKGDLQSVRCVKD